MPWYDGPTVMGYLDTVDVSAPRRQAGAFRMPVQLVNRPDPDFRGFAGRICTGRCAPATGADAAVRR